MAVTWSTKDARRPTVKWGEAEGKLDREAAGTTTTYTCALGPLCVFVCGRKQRIPASNK
jgi:hypothetical protein